MTEALLEIGSAKKIEKTIADYVNKIIKSKDLKPSEAHQKIQKIIKQIFVDIDLEFSFSRVDEKNNVLFKNKNNEEFYISELSTGEQTLLSKIFILYIQNIKNHIILIDEPEISLHTNIQNRVVKIYENFAKQNNNQIIIATHSPHILGSAKPESIKLLKLDNSEVSVVDSFTQSYGLEFSRILSEIMGIETLRTPDV